MKLRMLQLTNFRCFESLTVELDPQLTVLVADNGVGKTAVLESIAMGLDVFLQKLPFKGISRRSPKTTDIRKAEIANPTEYLRIRLETTEGIAWDRSEYTQKTSPKAMPKPIGQASIASYAGNVFRAWDGLGLQLPLIAFYDTGRTVVESAKVKRDIFEEFHADKAYRDALIAKPNFSGFFRYFYYLEDLERRGKEERRDWDYRLFQIDIIRAAISRMAPGFVNPHTELDPLCFMLDWEHGGPSLRLEQLSDGYKTVLAMVMDIASRIALLCHHSNQKDSPNIELALNSEGIVLIDEVDLHLHPSWQQKILPDLVRTFPAIQFIVTTHSPQVLTTIRRENIRVIGRNHAEPPLAMTYGEPSGGVMHSVMQVDPQPPVPEKAKLQKLTEWVDQGHYQSDDAQRVWQELLAALGKQHPQLQRLQRSIQRQEALKK